MSARAASSALILTLLMVPGFFRSAQAGPWLPAPGEYYAELRGGLFSADSYHNDDGDRVSLGGKWEERSAPGDRRAGLEEARELLHERAVRQRDAALTRPAPAPARGWRTSGSACATACTRAPTALAAELDWQGPLGYDRTSSVFGDPLRDGGLEQLSLALLYGTPIAKHGFLQLGRGRRLPLPLAHRQGQARDEPGRPRGPR